ncbi:sulfotransferase family 2 domain-containing protein [Sessilibacter sp. MAH1]
MRNIVLHYHLFKNAGTSVDAILKDSFGANWINWDKPLGDSATISPQEMECFINNNKHIQAISSHDLNPPLPYGNFKVFPIVFLRHPIIRARSAYLFEWKKQLNLNEPKGSFLEYIRENIVDGIPGVVSNFQCYKLSNVVYGENYTRKNMPDFEVLDRAKLFINSIPYFGLVEHFHQSLVRLHYYLKATFPNILVTNKQTNVTQNVATEVNTKLAQIQEELGEEIYTFLEKNNQLDLKLYNYAVNRFFSVVGRDSGV